jgi:hypothetical protein
MIDGFQLMIARGFIITAACVLGFSGCGKSRPMAQVRGQVVFTDGNAPQAGVRVIRFECAKDTDAALRKGAAGVINDDGTFELFTRRPGDGVHLGKYDVTFAIFRGATDQRPMIPAMYTKSATTPFHVVVEDDKDDYKFEINMGAAKQVAK